MTLWRRISDFRHGRRHGLGRSSDDGWRDYRVWLDAQIATRARGTAQGAPAVSLITPAFDPPIAILRETIASVFAQRDAHWEWVIVDNGSTNPDVVQLLAATAEDDRVRLIRLDRNAGIAGGMRRGLEAATNRIVVPLDADDLLVEDALNMVASTFAHGGGVKLVYSDEDVLREGRLVSPFFRPEWDPVLNLCSSYIFHLCAYDRAEALRLGVYTDSRASFATDWDTVLRFVAAGNEPAHVAHVLYHWRSHSGSQTNRVRPADESLEAQRHLLSRYLRDHAHEDHFGVAVFPISRGIPEPWLERKRADPATMDLVVAPGETRFGADAVEAVATTSAYPFSSKHLLHERSLAAVLEIAGSGTSDLLAFVSADVQPEGTVWPWEAQGLLELHPDAAFVSARIVNGDRIVVAGGEVFNDTHELTCPDLGRHESDPGPWALSLKQRSCDGFNSGFFVIRRDFLNHTLRRVPDTATWEGLGAWAGAATYASGRRGVFSPLVSATALGVFPGGWQLAEPEKSAFVNRETPPRPFRWFPARMHQFGYAG